MLSMKRMGDRQAGSGMIEILLLAVIVIVITVAGVYLWQQEHKMAPAKGTTDTTKPDPYAGWKTYTSSSEKLLTSV
jgi:hypothetical protein